MMLKPTIALVLLVALAACSSSETKAPCVQPGARPFGVRSRQFGEDVANLPSSLGEHVEYRGEALGEDFSLYGREIGDNAEVSAHNATGGLWSLLGSEFSRLNDIGDYASRAGERTSEDSRCFFERMWFHLKILE